MIAARRQRSRRVKGAAGAVGTVIAGLALRRVGVRSGVTNDEVRGELQGDDLVSDPLWTSTRAITVWAPPSAVWPWIVQMGFPAFRAGWYTPYWLDRLQWGITHRSADEIRPELQNLAVGDRVPDSADWSVFFTVEVVEPDRALVLLSTRHLLRPLRSIKFSWAFVLDPVGQGATRLSMRARAWYQPRWAGVVIRPLIGVGDFLNASAMLRGIKQRAETEHGASPESGSAKPNRRIGREFADVAMAAPLFVGAPLARRRHLRWGASDAEVGAAMPGDEIVSQSSVCATRAITIDAPPEQVWPWIVQIGFGRAGFYSYDLLDNAGRPSSTKILSEYQDPQVGDWVPMAANISETTAFKIAGFKANSWMLWAKPDSTWAWKLTLLEGNRTRLVARLKDRYEWRAAPAASLLSLVLFELGDYAMMRKQLLGIKARAEGQLRVAPSRLG